MAGRLEGKKCFVTAAGQGIGRATALAYAREGGTVVATDRDAPKLESLAAQGITTLALDVLDSAAIQAAIAQHGPFDVVFNCAGFVHQNDVVTCTDEDWDFAFALNVRSQWKVIQAALPGMLQKGGGAIVNMASAAGSVKGVANRFVYGTTKAAVVGMTKSVAADFVSRGIRCNCVCPGTVDTPSLGERIAANAAVAGSMDAARAGFVSRQPMGRLSTPEEIAELVLYLSAPESAFVTAQAVIIDGGWTN
jgi:2-keto-3-deoxy-L-fuconate dehydrogenase